MLDAKPRTGQGGGCERQEGSGHSPGRGPSEGHPCRRKAVVGRRGATASHSPFCSLTQIWFQNRRARYRPQRVSGPEKALESSREQDGAEKEIQSKQSAPGLPWSSAGPSAGERTFSPLGLPAQGLLLAGGSTGPGDLFPAESTGILRLAPWLPSFTEVQPPSRILCPL